MSDFDVIGEVTSGWLVLILASAVLLAATGIIWRIFA